MGIGTRLQQTLGLGQPTGGWLGISWLVVLATLAAVVLYGFFQLVQFASTPALEDTTLILPIITTALGALVGLLVGGSAAPTGRGDGGGTSQ